MSVETMMSVAADGHRTLDASLDASLLAGRYRLLEPLGRGGMGTVWHGRDELLAREVAIKEVPLPPGPERTILAERTRREARATARISHPNVAGVYDVIEVAGQPWIVLELVRSRTLGQVVAQDGPLSSCAVAKIGLAVLDGLCAAHAAGILHRDIKPDNVLLAQDGRVVLTDFGIAVMDSEASITQAGMLTGTMAYLAPERVTGDACRQSDLWSLGATLFLAVEGRPPFSRDTAIHTLAAVLADPPDPFERAGPLAVVLAGLLHKNPTMRPDAVRVREQLRHVADLWPPEERTATPLVRTRVEETLPFVPGFATPSMREPQLGRSKARWALMVGLFALLTAGAAWSAGMAYESGARQSLTVPVGPLAPAAGRDGLFEGRDAAGKGGTIKRFGEHLNPPRVHCGRLGQARRACELSVVLPATLRASAVADGDAHT